ncbi:MAG: M90 family metallopeptidase [Tateyamaria sp.]|jgi:Mlc titration factor MtfA (ptsG expression regulator)|uniref:M90 family metallopeptidase n=1 Tax=unclassified Tateyamaria TaxID=2645127 RepID=UPI000D557B34|nr:M90 family metallopeptidase [Tateyamaria sp. Alg231-49]
MLVLLLIIVVLGVIGALYVRRVRHRRALLSAPLTDREWDILFDAVPLLRRMPVKFRAAFEGKVNLFLDQVEFQGCNGLEVTEDMELSVAAQACLLVVNTDRWYDKLTTVLMYPAAFKSKQVRRDGYVVSEAEVVRTGESWSRGPVILSWRDAQIGAEQDRSGHNVVLHEFAHQLDDMSGRTNGIPVLEPGQAFATWEAVFVDAFNRHVDDVENGRRTAVDAYGATNHQEYFAVVIELFYERPAVLKRAEPKVYEQISKLLRLDPVTWG